ncbi:RNA polymerase sigma factor [Actinophytocola sp.]|uniref:RNA polymerase sigma factor n=1 Tax=Actinophytocola sp. TaxID=1872138 RepID=UPI0025BFB122|nr:RNA polymerase sigma factor [Actinophytocola sp.]
MVPADEAPALARTAYLLTGDQNHADWLTRAYLDRDTLVAAWLADPGQGYEPDPSPRTGAELAAELLRRALGELLPRQRAAVVLRYWAGLSVEEAAAALGCLEQAVVAETTVALEQMETDGERLAAELAALAAGARPSPVDPAEPETGQRQRMRAVGVAVVVLVAAGVFAAMLGVGEPTSAPRVDSDEWSPPPTVWTVPLFPPGLPTVEPPEDTVAVIDERSRRLTEQLLDALPTVLPGVADLRPGPVGPQIVNLPRPALEFYTGVTLEPGSYLAQASYGTPPDTTVVVIEVQFRDPDADPRYSPCPEFELDCTFSMLPDGTSADVNMYTDPGSGRMIHSLTSLRPDGTFLHVTVFNLERSPFPPEIGVAELLRFADVFTY